MNELMNSVSYDSHLLNNSVFFIWGEYNGPLSCLLSQLQVVSSFFESLILPLIFSTIAKLKNDAFRFSRSADLFKKTMNPEVNCWPNGVLKGKNRLKMRSRSCHIWWFDDLISGRFCSIFQPQIILQTQDSCTSGNKGHRGQNYKCIIMKVNLLALLISNSSMCLVDGRLAASLLHNSMLGFC